MMPPVEHSHLVPLRRKETNHAGAYEAGSTDDKNAHSNLARRMPRLPTWRKPAKVRPLHACHQSPLEHGYNVEFLIPAELLCKPIR